MKIIKFIKINRKLIAACLLLVLAILGIIKSESVKVMLISVTKRDLPIFCVEKDYKVCSLSFDILNDEQDIDSVIKHLEKYDITATFFVSGQWVDKNQQCILKLSEAGHEVMNHSDTNPHLTQLTEKDIFKEVENCNDKIEKIIGVRPILFRPPYGEYDDKTIKVIRNIGMETTLWDCDSMDNRNVSSDKIRSRVLKNIKPGSIVLFHSASKETSKALPSIIEGLIKEGYEFTPVTQLIYQDDYIINSSGKQIPICN